MNELEDVLGLVVGVRFKHRGVDDNHILIQVLIEDDGFWHEKGVVLSSAWIDDAIMVLKDAKLKMKSKANKSSCGYGFEFRDDK